MSGPMIPLFHVRSAAAIVGPDDIVISPSRRGSRRGTSGRLPFPKICAPRIFAESGEQGVDAVTDDTKMASCRRRAGRCFVDGGCFVEYTK